jgi:diguanylate cyclase (GGDEF)-like protein
VVAKNLVSLHLDQSPAAASASDIDVLRRTLDDACATLADVLAAGDTGTLGEVIAAVDRCRAELMTGSDADAVEPSARACFEAARNAAAQATIRAALLATVRETLAAIDGNQASLQETLSGSAERFERLAQVSDLQQIQAQLVREVTTLKRVTIEKRSAWERMSKEFGTRLTTLEGQLDRTRREAAVDPLTNVANRRTFERTCREWLEPNRPGFVIGMVDVDDFKAINDRCGHATGDRMLVAVAETLARSLRSGDVVARLGGDEFAILASGLTLTQAESRFAAIGRAVQQACKPLVEADMPASISIGVAECSAGDTIDSLQQRADAALYQAKRTGKGRVAAKACPFIRELMKGRDGRSRA